ncbi:MAG TPA: tetratricopeptide repeat protein [Anaerolineales bacterium]|nr:tetratricopeptide repeat protein [Anaerolineales bacterium]
MSETASLKRTLIHWDEQHVKSLLCEPEFLLDEEPWNTWVKGQGGLTAIYASIRNLPLSEKQRKTLAALIADPGASLQKYSLSLHVSVATFVRYRASLIKTLVTVLNAHLLEKQPLHGEVAKLISDSKTNLPYQHLPLIGRARELEALHNLLLREEVNLVTVTGSGGIGKTRLALQVASDLLKNFEHGVFFVPLASITNPDFVATTITGTLGVKGGENQPVVDFLKNYLRDKQILLVLDNFEQLTPAAPLLNELLTAAPDLKILVTSRAVLHLHDEYEFNVPPLSVPDLDNLPSLEALAQSPAVALFVGRAQAVKTDFTLTKENAPVIAEICVRLDGIPLALELAAVRIKLFAPQALLKGLSHRLAFLAQKNVDGTPRHQTLRNAIAWSYQLLEADEQALYSQLGVFAGGCTLEAIEAVCTWDNASGATTLEQLASLVDKSMLQHEVRPDGEPRFMLLETLREYALEQLEAAGQTEEVRRKHLAYYLKLVEAIEPGPKDPNLGAWMKRLEEEHDNLRLALEWALGHDEIEPAERIAGAVWRFWQIHGHVEEGTNWMKAVLSRSDGDTSLARAKALWGAGWLGMVRGTLNLSRKYFEEGATISRKLGNDRFLGLSLHGSGAVARAQGNFEQSRVAFEESLPLFEALESTEDVAWTFVHLGVTALEKGDFEQAVAHLSQGLELFRTLDQRWPRAEALTFLGHAALQQRDYALAQKRYEDALAFYEELEDRSNIAILNSYISATLFGRDEIKRAIDSYQENLVISNDVKDYWGLVWGIERLAEAAEKTGQDARSARLWGAADALRHVAGVLWHPGFHSYYTEERFAGLQARLGEAQWKKLWAEGQALSVEQAVAEALRV